MSNSARQASKVSINKTRLSKAAALKIDGSKAAGAGLVVALTETRAELWLTESRAALESSNAYVEQHGLPLTQYRGF